MDQDFHHYGTYMAAMLSGFDQESAFVIARAANFVDFLTDSFPRRWHLLDQYHRKVIADYDIRYTCQRTIGAAVSPALGTWTAFHFLPGNWKDDTIPLTKSHADWARAMLPQHRAVNTKTGGRVKAVTRPLSMSSKLLTMDTVNLANKPEDAGRILSHAPAYEAMLRYPNREFVIDRFIKALIGIRAHVIADTWAHQDWIGNESQYNTYTDITGNPLYSGIKYHDQGKEDNWHSVVLGVNEYARLDSNFIATPRGITVGHGWMGHFPDISFLKYQYRPSWSKDVVTRDNKKEFHFAFYDLLNLFSKTAKNAKAIDKNSLSYTLDTTIGAPSSMKLLETKYRVLARQFSADRWTDSIRKNFGSNAVILRPHLLVDVAKEPCDNAIPDCGFEIKKGNGAYLPLVNGARVSDMYLFQLAADYHFHFVRNWLWNNGIKLNDNWDYAKGPLDGINDLVNDRLQALTNQYKAPSSNFYTMPPGGMDKLKALDKEWQHKDIGDRPLII